MKQYRLLSVLVLLSLILGACAQPSSTSSKSRLVYGLTLAPSGIDPHVDVSSELGIPLSNVYDPLLFRMEDGSFVPGLAEDWSISEDGTVYTFYLRSGVKFHDGTEFNAEAVKRTLDRIVDPNTQSRKAILLLGPYESSAVLDPLTIEVRLREPYAPLLDAFSQVYLAPASPAALNKWGAEYQFHQVGTGPYIMQEYVPKDHLTLIRNPDYSLDSPYYQISGPATVDEIEFRFLVEPAVRSLSLEAGDADIVGEIPPQDALRLSQSEGISLQPVPISGLPLVAFLNTANDPTSDVRLRQALIQGTDRTELVRTVFSDYSPVADGPLSHNHTSYSASLDSLYPYDPASSRSLLDEAGWLVDAETGMRKREGTLLQLQALVMSWGMVPEVAELLQAQWRELGIELVVEPVTFPAAMTAVAENRYHLIFWSEPGTDADILRSFFHSENMDVRNWSKANMPALDELLDKARTEVNDQKREELYAQVQEMIMREALVLPIRDYVNLNGVRDCVSGLRFDSRGWFPILHDVTLSGTCR